MEQQTERRRKGLYNTDTGNVAYVGGPSAKTALDIDSRCRIPMDMVTTFIRPLSPGERYSGGDKLW